MDTFILQKSVPSGNKIYGDTGKDIFTVKGGTGNFIYGGKDGDNFTVTGGKKNEIHGNAGIDTFTVSSSATKENVIYGDEGKDVFTIKGGSDNKIYGGKDNDRITVSGGSNLINADAGNDTIIINGGTNRPKREISYDASQKKVGKFYAGGIFAGAGSDTITVNKGNNYISAGIGDDVINVNGGNSEPSYKYGKNKDTEFLGGVFGGNGNDTITVKNVSNSLISGGVGNFVQKGETFGKDGNNEISVTGGSMNSIDGGNGDDIITVNGGSNSWITGGGGKDTITVNNATNDIISGSENATVTVTGGSQNKINTSDNVKLYVKSGTGHVITDEGDNGKSYIEITQANNVTLNYRGDYWNNGTGNSSSHTSEFAIKGGNGHKINLADSGAKVSITGGSNHTLSFCFKDDLGNYDYGMDNTVNVKWTQGIGALNIYEGDGTNILNISGVNSSSFNFQLKGSNLVLTNTSSTGDSIIFNNWLNAESMPELRFSDGSYDHYAIEEKLGLYS